MRLQSELPHEPHPSVPTFPAEFSGQEEPDGRIVDQEVIPTFHIPGLTCTRRSGYL